MAAKKESTKMALMQSLLKEPLDYEKIKKSMTEHYGNVLEDYLSVLDEVAKKERFTPAQKKEMEEALILLVKIHETNYRMQQNARNHDELAKEDTQACQFLVNKLTPMCENKMNRNATQYGKLSQAIAQAQTKSKAPTQAKKAKR